MQKNASSNYHTIQIVFLLIHENAPNIAKILVICNTKKQIEIRNLIQKLSPPFDHRRKDFLVVFRDHPFSTYAKFSEKITLLTP